MYSFQSRIRYSEIDHKGSLTLPGLINYFQDCSTFQSEDIGLGMDVLKQKRKAWVLSYWQIKINKLPKLGETVNTGTFATAFQGLYGYRDFVMKDLDGNDFAQAHSLWVYMDLEKGRPIRPKEEDILPYGMEPALDLPYEERKIILPETTKECEAFPVLKYQIDTNEHVNNCQYVQMAIELLPKDMQIHQVRVEYKKSAVLGDIIYPKLAIEENRAVVLLCNELGKAYAVIEIK